VDMATFKASFNNQWLLDWVKMQVTTVRDIISIILRDICHVNGGGTWPMTLSPICLL
jgi:hypothetical protein